MPEDIGLFDNGTLVACVGPGSDGSYASFFPGRCHAAAEAINVSTEEGRCGINIFNDLVFLCDKNGSYVGRLIYLNEPPRPPSMSNASVGLFNKTFCEYQGHAPERKWLLPVEVIETLLVAVVFCVVGVLAYRWYKSGGVRVSLDPYGVADGENVAGEEGGRPRANERSALLETTV